MSAWLRTLWSRCRAMLTSSRLDRDFDDELTTHLELLVDEERRRGLAPADARREALRRLGRLDLLRETHRAQRGLPFLDWLAQDVRYGLRMLWKSRGFTAVAVVSLALGIGGNTALFSLVDNLLIRTLPVRDPGSLVQLQVRATTLGMGKTGGSFPTIVFDRLRERNDLFDHIAGYSPLDRPAVVLDGYVDTSRHGERVSANFLRDLGVAPVLGRMPVPAEVDVAVISHRLWRSRFGERTNVLGSALTVDGRAYTIVGVAPPRFVGLSIDTSADLWIVTAPGDPQQPVARLKPGVTPAQAQVAVAMVFDQIVRDHPRTIPWGPRMEVVLAPAGKGLSRLRTEYQRPLLALGALVTLVLLITCTNVANLLMVRNCARARERTVRVAVGASRGRLALQYLVESVLLVGLGAVLGLLFARWGVSVLHSMLPVPAIPEILVFQLDGRLLGFVLVMSLLSVLLFGLAAAWRAAHVDLTVALRSGTTSSHARSPRSLGRWLVGCQVALSVLLLAGAGLFVKTLRNLGQVDVGFNADRLVQVKLDTRGSGYDQGQIEPLYRLLLDRASAIPGVASVTGIRNDVMRAGFTRGLTAIPGRTLGPSDAWWSATVGPSFFETPQIPVRRGRAFTAGDFAAERQPVIISESLARLHFPNEDPIGRRIGGQGALEIVGVVADARIFNVRTPAGPTMYFTSRNDADRIGALLLRTTGDPTPIVSAVRAETQRINPRLVVDARTMREEIDRNLARERMVAATSAFFSMLGLLLASVGVFGVGSYSVTQRTNELGIRMALGAGRWSVIRAALRDTLTVFGVGLVAGIAGAILLLRVTAAAVAELLFGLTATDAANVIAAILLVTAVVLLGCVLPARRATSIDPLLAIRHE
jgi:predicted permease